MTRRNQIVQAAMAALRYFDGEPVEEAQIHSRVNPLITPKPSPTELSHALEFCREKGLATYIVSDLDTLQWALTPRGKITEVR